MTDQITSLLNSFETTLSSQMTDSAESAVLTSVSGLVFDGVAGVYLVIEPDSVAQREVILFTGVVSSTLNTSTANRYLTGSAATSGLTHPTGSVVRMVPLQQHIEDLNDRVDADAALFAAHDGGTDPADHPEATDSVRGFMSAADKTKLDAMPASVIAPSGVITAYGGASAPTGWLLCDGSAVSRTTYSDLFAILSTTYGVGDGSTTFNVPDLQQRFPLGKAASGTGDTLAATGGNIDHVHTGPSHQHSVSLTAAATGSPGQDSGYGESYGTLLSHTHAVTGNTGAEGTGNTGPNNAPFLVVNYIVKT